MSLIHRGQQGFTTVTVMGVLMVGGLLVAAGFAAVDPDISLSRGDQDSKQAYGAAEAGLQWYLSRLSQDNSFYVHCTNVAAPSPGEVAPVNDPWDGVGADEREWRRLPGEHAQYTVELLPAPGFSRCVEGNQYSMIDPSGNMQLRISGKSRGKVRTILATLRRQNFLDFIYFTDFETSDPATYSDVGWAESNCVTYRAARDDDCLEIQFAPFDDIKGPLHTNDSARVCGSPTFGRNPRDAIEIVGTPKYDPNRPTGCASPDPRLLGTLVNPASPLGMPPSNAELANIAEPTYRFRGKTSITLAGDVMNVVNFDRYGSLATQTLPLPPNGVVYVSNIGCSGGYVRSQPYKNIGTTKEERSCGNAWVSGNYNRDLTIATANDVVIDGSLTRTNPDGGTLLGLVANNFVRVYHPVDFDAHDNDVNGCANRGGYLKTPTIEAAILALKHSFIHDNWHCGRPTGALKVFGAIAQRFRGPVGTVSGDSVYTGYEKEYEYNDRLRYREPPYFLDPVQASWRISRETEQARSVMER